VAGSSTTWIAVSASVTPSSAGVLDVILDARYDGQVFGSPCYWDYISWI